MATLDRSNEIVLFLESLKAQAHKDFELIIVDQNQDDRVQEICDSYRQDMNIHIIKSAVKGLSFNRNIGMRYITGDIVAFPDDDCEYAASTLQKIAVFFLQNADYSFYTCATREKEGARAIFHSQKTDTDISTRNVMSVGISFTIFIRAEKIHDFKFDEMMGVGAEFGSGEESDMLLYLLKNKCKGRYHAKNFIYHPHKDETPQKAFQYGKGFGAVYKKAVIRYNYFLLLFVFLLRILKGIFNVIIYHNKKMRIASLRGRIKGFLQYKCQ
jgi:glycosyltransferase involved in cell wall biosynthesis